MEGKDGNDSSSSKTPNEQRSPQRAEGSIQRQPSSTQWQLSNIQRQRSPRIPDQVPRISRIHSGRSPGRPPWGTLPIFNYQLHAIPVGGSEDHDAMSSSVDGFSTDAASRKRVRELTQEMPAVDSGSTGDHDQFPFTCILCGRGFYTNKSLFGHMRTHRDRSWKGALPPPVFSREEFADTAALLNPIGGDQEEDEEQEVDQPVVQEETPAVEGGASVVIQEAGNVMSPTQDPQGRVVQQYRVPDLNLSPPEEGKGNDDNNNWNMG